MRGLSSGFRLQLGLSKAVVVAGFLNAAPESRAISEPWDLRRGETVKFTLWLQSAAIPCFVSDLLLQMWAGIASFLCRSICGCCRSSVEATRCRAAVGTSRALLHASRRVWCPCFMLLLSRIVTVTRAVSRPVDGASALIPGMKLRCLSARRSLRGLPEPRAGAVCV